MAGPGFDFISTRDPKEAAMNVQCIHTSIAGTIERKCHQNWLMGNCGKYQDGGDDLQVAYCTIMGNCSTNPILSHSLCPFFYNSAFTHDFTVDKKSSCLSTRMAKNLPDNFKMGYMETRRRRVSKNQSSNG